MEKSAKNNKINENRISYKFRTLKQSGKKALIGFLTAGDPDLKSSERDIRCALDKGIDILELGVPFSDPMVDGPVIQAASERALKGGITISGIFNLVEKLRDRYDNPVVLFGYVNPFMAYGYYRLCRDASNAGIDGILAVDLSFRERGKLRSIMKQSGLVLIPLIAPTTSKERARIILRNAEGFIYYISIKGVTGSRKQIDPEIKSRIAAVKQNTDLPVVAGFGITNGAQAKKLAELTDGVVIGSALIKAARENRLSSFIKEIRKSLDE